ncbi:MAG TPA: chorismate-binding protein [Thermoanaerobaculia bacterium]|nr:chorismate-binding protein [Thermoanaerobaculia bacterium]
MPDFALIQLAPGRFLLGWGPFRHLPSPDPLLPSFYLNDYFLDAETPWKIPDSWEIVERGELGSRLGGPQPPAIDWQPLDDVSFQSLFRSAHSALARGEFGKIVPIMFQTGVVREGDPAAYLVERLAMLPPEMWAYAYRIGEEGMAGASPETLFTLGEGLVETMAVAGTRGLDRVRELADDPKEREEHELVVRDLEQQLRDLGRVEVSPTTVVELPTLAHLVTLVSVRPRSMPSFEEVVRRLHPTAALGSSPRNEAARQWLRNADRGIGRGTFGAPFGVLFEDRSAICLVAIRNVAWNGERVRIGSGAGVLVESTLENERKELKRKRDQVRALFGLAPERDGVPA